MCALYRIAMAMALAGCVACGANDPDAPRARQRGAPTAVVSDCGLGSAPFTPPAEATPRDDYDVDAGPTVWRREEVLHGTSTFVDRYNWQKQYLDREAWNWDENPRIRASSRCVVEFQLVSGDWNCYAINIGNYGLEKYSKYIAGADDAEAAKLRFFEVADWFVAQQDPHGGWPADYDHLFFKGRTEVMPAGWYSGMAQGLAMSILVRAYFVTGKLEYFEAAHAAIGVLRTTVEDGGVMRDIDGHAIYEEYPTYPMINVLNGYLFAVMGLYDFSQLAREPIYACYFAEGVETLKAIVSRYDLGSFTAYDLSHWQNPGAYPNRARWGYHTLHVTQLTWLYAVTGDEFFTPIIERWQGYSEGRAVLPH